MARITVEDCLEKIDNQYELVLLAKERTCQLIAGDQALVPEDNDKKTVISLREIGEGKISINGLQDSAVNKLRSNPESTAQNEEGEEIKEDNFDKIYKGEISKSGSAILPSKRVRQAINKVEKNDADKHKEKNLEAAEENEEDKKE